MARSVGRAENVDRKSALAWNRPASLPSTEQKETRSAGSHGPRVPVLGGTGIGTTAHP